MPPPPVKAKPVKAFSLTPEKSEEKIEEIEKPNFDVPSEEPKELSDQFPPTQNEDINDIINEDANLEEIEEEESTAEKITDTALDFIPIIGGIKDIVKGIKNGDGVSIAIGVVSIVVDVATAGGGSLIKGAAKTVGKTVIKEGAESLAKKSIKESVEAVTKEGAEQAVKKFDDYNQARNAALEWLEKRGFTAEIPTKGKFGTSKGKNIGMQTTDTKKGFRVEFDERSGGHINVWDNTAKKGHQKGPHFEFKSTEKTVNKIIRRFSR